MPSPQTPQKLIVVKTPFTPKKPKKTIQRLPKNMEASTLVKKIDFDFYKEKN